MIPAQLFPLPAPQHGEVRDADPTPDPTPNPHATPPVLPVLISQPIGINQAGTSERAVIKPGPTHGDVTPNLGGIVPRPL